MLRISAPQVLGSNLRIKQFNMGDQTLSTLVGGHIFNPKFILAHIICNIVIKFYTPIKIHIYSMISNLV